MDRGRHGEARGGAEGPREGRGGDGAPPAAIPIAQLADRRRERHAARGPAVRLGQVLRALELGRGACLLARQRRAEQGPGRGHGQGPLGRPLRVGGPGGA
eukprot:9788755-Alexandrium_andersonii.AAC.1